MITYILTGAVVALAFLSILGSFLYVVTVLSKLAENSPLTYPK